MNVFDECALSCYEDIGVINEEHNVKLTQHADTGKFFVKKTCRRYHLPMLHQLREHPVKGMPRIFELFENDGRLTIIEEYVSGDTLEEKLREHGPFSEDEVLDWVFELCRIIGELHSFTPPIIHRDIKPSNIIITPDGSLKLLDLSAARQSSEEKSQDTVIMGTAGYAAPEQYGFSASSEATDIYAIGVVMNRLLTGKMLNKERYSGGLGPIIKKCTELNSYDRYQNITDLKQALQSYVRNDAPENKAQAPEADSSGNDWKRLLPPGFRSGKPIAMIFATLGYAMCFSVSLSMKSTKGGLYATLVNRFCVTLMFLGLIFFTGNYLNIQSKFPLSGSSNPAIRIIGIILWDFVIIAACALLVVFLGG